MEGTPLLDVLRGLILEPDAQAAFNADPSGYMERYGYDDVDADQMGEAVTLVADTLPSDVAQQVNDAAEPTEGEGDGDALGMLQRLSSLDVDSDAMADDGAGDLDYGGMEGEYEGGDEADLDPFGDPGEVDGADEVTDDLGDDGGPDAEDVAADDGDSSFGDDLDDDTFDDDGGGFGGGLASGLDVARSAVDDVRAGVGATGGEDTDDLDAGAGFGEGSDPEAAAGGDTVTSLFDGGDDTFEDDDAFATEGGYGDEGFAEDDTFGGEEGGDAYGGDDTFGEDDGAGAFGYDDPDEGGQSYGGDEADDQLDDGDAGGEDIGLF